MANYTIEGIITAITCKGETLKQFLGRIRLGLGLGAFHKYLALAEWMMCVSCCILSLFVGMERG